MIALHAEPKKILPPSLLGAPPPYQLYRMASSFPHEEFRRRSSWSELAAAADMEKHAMTPPSTISSFVSVGGAQLQANNGGATSVGSHPSLCSSQTGVPSATYVNNHGVTDGSRFLHDAYALPTKAGATDSRQLSVSSSSGVISDFFTFAKGLPYHKFTETGVHFSPMPPGQTTGSPPGCSALGSTNIGTTPIGSAYRGIGSSSAGAQPIPAARSAGASSAGCGDGSSTGSRHVKRDRMEELRQCCRKTPSRLTFCALIALLLVALIVAIVLYQFLHLPTHLQFTWLAPELLRSGQPTPNQLQMDVAGQQVRFELAGNMPFKSNFVSVLDFKTNKVAIVDSSLRAGSRNLVCFVMELDRASINDIASLQRAATNSVSRTAQHLGWQETWNYIPVPLSMSAASTQRLFQPDVVECRGARWIELRPVNTNQKPIQCSECFDFCLPDYGIEKDYIRDDSFLNIVRRACFHLFVPEWRSYAQSYSNQQNQQDFENYYRHNGQYRIPANVQQQQQQEQQLAGRYDLGAQGPQSVLGPQGLQPQFQSSSGYLTGPHVNGQIDYSGQSNNYGGGGNNGRTLGQQVVGTLNHAGRELGDTLANSVGPAVQQGGQRFGEIIGGARSQLQNVGDHAEAKWIDLQNVPGKIANASSTAWNSLQGGANYVKQQLFNENNRNSNNNNNNNGNSQFPTTGFEFAESQFTRSSQPNVVYGSGGSGYGNDQRNLAPEATQFSNNAGIPPIGEINPNYNQPASIQRLLQQQLDGQRQQPSAAVAYGSNGYGTANYGTPQQQHQQLQQQQLQQQQLQQQQQTPRLSQMFDDPRLNNNNNINNNNYDTAFGVDLSNQRRGDGYGNDASSTAGGGVFGADLSRRPFKAK